jgi:hypothetical protein
MNCMKREAFTKLLKSAHARELELNSTKGKDYAGDDDALRNFKEAADDLGLTPEQVLGVYLHKHYSAIRSYIEHGALASEPIQGRIDDARLYLALFEGLVQERADAAAPSEPKPKRTRRTAAQIAADKAAATEPIDSSPVVSESAPDPFAEPVPVVEPVADSPQA